MVEDTVQDCREVEPVTAWDMMLSFLICLATILVFIVWDVRLLHWCLIPLFICGVIVGTDAVRWLRRRLDTFDPKGIIGVFGLNFFFLAPLLVAHYGADYSQYDGGTPRDWRFWIGVMGWLNVLGLTVYQLSQWFSFRHCRPAKKLWLPSPGRSQLILWTAILFSTVAWGIVMVRMGGFGGMVEEKLYMVGRKAGLGSFRFLAAALVPLLFMAFSIRRKSNARVSILLVVLALVLAAVIQFLTSGFLGSRRIVVFALVWVVGIIHYHWHELSPKMLLLIMVPVVLFAFVYGLYKAAGARFLDVLRGRASLAQVAAATDETLGGVLVTDISRADVQAWMVYKQRTFRGDYTPRHGRTYLWAPITLRPSWLFPKKVGHSEKTIAGTEYMYGKGYFDPSKGRASFRVYGLAGEAILNFGLWAIPLAFACWGFLVGYLRKKWISWPMGDSRLLIMPFLTILAVWMLASDSDNFWNAVIGHLIIPAFVIFLISSRSYLDTESQLESEAVANYEVAADVSWQRS